MSLPLARSCMGCSLDLNCSPAICVSLTALLCLSMPICMSVCNEYVCTCVCAPSLFVLQPLSTSVLKSLLFCTCLHDWPRTYVLLCLCLLSLRISVSARRGLGNWAHERAPGQKPTPALLLAPKRQSTTPCGSSRPGCPRCACIVERMNGGIATGALAPGDARKPGAPEDAVSYRCVSKGTEDALHLVEMDHVTVLAAPTVTRPHLTSHPRLASPAR